MTEEKCPRCKGYGKVYDPVYTWAHVECAACEGTGIATEWYKKILRSSEVQSPNQTADKVEE